MRKWFLVLLFFLLLTGCTSPDTDYSTKPKESVSSKSGISSLERTDDTVSGISSSGDFRESTGSNSTATSKAGAGSSKATASVTSNVKSPENIRQYIQCFDPNQQKGILTVLKEVNNTADYSSLIKSNMQNTEKFFKDYFFYRFVGQNNRPIIDQINAEYPIECLRRVRDQTYSIYKEGGGLIFVFYDNGCEESHCVYMKKKLSSDDFRNVKSETPLSVVEGIDPAAAIWANHAISLNSKQFSSDHLLTDGLLRFTYTCQKSGQFQVSKRYFSRNFRCPENMAVINYNYSILPQDYIH